MSSLQSRLIIYHVVTLLAFLAHLLGGSRSDLLSGLAITLAAFALAGLLWELTIRKS